MWDQHGGFLCDREGNLKKEWCWKSDQEQEKIVVKVNTCVFRFAEDTHAKARCCALEAMNSSDPQRRGKRVTCLWLSRSWQRASRCGC